MKLFEFYESSPSYVDDELTSYVNMGEWYENAVKEYREKGLEALFQYISRTKSGKLAGKDIQTIKHDFESDRDQYETEEAAVAEFLDFLNNIPEGKNKSKQSNPVAKHSRNMSGAGAHKSAKDYDRKDAKKEIEKDLEDDDYIDNKNMGHPDGVTSDEEDKLHGRIHKIREKSDAMIGEPDAYYDAEQRQEAYDDLEDALQGNYMDSYIKDGSCPACAGNGYMDGEEEVYNDETEEYEEGTECDGFGNYGCDEGEMTYGSDGPSWVEIIKHDRRKSEREKAKANYPGDEKVINQIRNMVMGMDDPRMAMQQMAIDYPHMGRRQRAELVAKGMKAAGLTNEGQRCWKGYEKKGTKKMFGKTVNNCVKKEGVNMNENKWKEVPQGKGKDGKEYFIALTTDNMPLDWPTYWEWEQSHGETNKNKASLRFANYQADAKEFLGIGEGRIEDTFGTKTIDKHDKPEKKKSKKDESIQAGDELMIETADGEGIVVPVLHVVDENILVGWDELAEDIVVEGARQLEELRKLAGIEIQEGMPGDLQRLYDKVKVGTGRDFDFYAQKHAPYFSDALKRYGDVKSIEAKDSGFVDIYVKELLTIAKMLGESIEEAEYQGRKVKLGKPTRGDVKKFKVYVKDPKTGNVKKVNFGHGGSSAKKAGQKTMKIKKSNPARRKSFRARHNCDNPGPRTKARYWSCRAW